MFNNGLVLKMYKELSKQEKNKQKRNQSNQENGQLTCSDISAENILTADGNTETVFNTSGHQGNAN